MVCIILSIVAYCLKTTPSFTLPIIQLSHLPLSNQPLNLSSPLTSLPNQFSIFADGNPEFSHAVFLYIEFICNVWFTVEFLIRLVVTDGILKFLRSPLNIIDITAVVSFYVDLCVTANLEGEQHAIAKSALELFSIVRVMRLFKLTRYISGLKILILTFKASAKELSLLVFFLMVFIVLFAALVFYAERFSPSTVNDFTSIPIGLWWAIVTMTTVGFGDQVPRSYAGKLILLTKREFELTVLSVLPGVRRLTN